MYSIVLMAALTSGPDVGNDPLLPLFGCSGYTGYGTCMGCAGYHFRGLSSGLGVRGFHRHSCFGSCHGCCGVSCHGCCGVSCHGCGGSGWPSPSTFTIGPGDYAPQAGQYGWVGSCLGAFPANGCAGGCSGMLSYWAPPSGIPLYTLHGLPWSGTAAPEAPFMTVPQPKPLQIPPIEPGTAAPQSTATVKFTLPAEAKLFVNGAPTKQTGAQRSFVTPPLARGDRYGYEVRAELMVDGKLEVEERQVVVTAGTEVSESFPKLIALARREGDRLTGK